MRGIMMLQNVCKGIAGKLSPLIRIEDFRSAKAIDGLFECLYTEVSIKGVR